MSGGMSTPGGLEDTTATGKATPTRGGGAWGRRLAMVTAAYGCVLLLLPCLWAWRGEVDWPLILARYLPQALYLVPLAVLGLLALLMRSWTRLGLVMAESLLVVLFYMGPKFQAFASTSPAPTSPVRSVRVLTFNIEGCQAGVNRVVEVIQEAAPDVLILQEVRGSARDRRADPWDALRAGLKGWHGVRGTITDELAIMSLVPLEEAKEIDLGAGRHMLACQARGDGWSARVANVHYLAAERGRSLSGSGWRFATYLEHTAEVRRRQTDRLLAWVQSATGPVILGGDFNTPARSDAHDRLRMSLRNAFDECGHGFGYTWSSTRPMWRIDHIYCGGGVVPRRCSPLDTRVSDHRPVAAVVDVPAVPPPSGH